MSEDPQVGLSDFFHNVWEDTNGFVYLPTLNRDTGEWRPVFFEWPIHEPHIIYHVLQASAKGLDAYYSPVLYKNHSTPTKDNVLGSHVIWVEFDGKAPASWDGDSGTPEPSEGLSGAHAASDDRLPAPTMRLQSSMDGHEHVYWKLDNLVTDKDWIESKNRSITYTMRSDVSGWDVVQILRPPFTQNTKRDMPVTVISIDKETRHETAKFEFLKAPAILVGESIQVDDLPPVESIIAKYVWDDEHWKMFRDPNIPEGKRSDALMRLGYFCIEAGMTDTEAYAILINADDRWGKYKNRADRKRRLVDIINRARIKHPNPKTELTFAGLLGTAAQTPEKGLPTFYGFTDFLDSDVEIEWVVEGLLEKGGFGIVASMPGVGKTQLSIQFAICCALGLPFLGWQIEKPQKVALFSLEMSHVALKIFLQTIAQAYSDEQKELLNQNLIIVPIGEGISLEKQEGMAYLQTILDEIQPEGIVIDSIGKLSMDDLNEKTAKLLNTRYLSLRARYGCFIWLIHHNRKASENNKKPTDISDVYGNQYITAETTSCLVLWRDKEDYNLVEVIPVKMRLSELRKPFYTQRDSNLYFTVVEGEVPKATDVTTSMGRRLGNALLSGIGSETEEDSGKPPGFLNL